MCNHYGGFGLQWNEKEISILKGLHISALHKEQMPDLYRFIARLLRYNEMQKQYDQKRLFDCLMDFHRRYRTMAKYGEKKWLRRKIFTLRDRLFQMRMKKYDK